MLVVKSFRGYFGKGVGADVEPSLVEVAEYGVESRFVLFPDTLTAQLDGGDDSSDCVEGLIAVADLCLQVCYVFVSLGGWLWCCHGWLIDWFTG